VTSVIDFPTTLTHSSEQCFKTCPRKYFLQYVLGLRPQHDSDALRIGSAFHVGLESLKNALPEDAAADAVRLAYADATCPPWSTPEDFAVEQEIAVSLVRGYSRRYATDAILRTVAVELPFALPIVNPETGRATPSYLSCGKMDWIAQLPDGRMALVEHKTVGESIEPESDYWKRLALDGQISRYILAAQELGYPVETVIYDVVRKPQISPKRIVKADAQMALAQGHYFGHPLDGPLPERETPELYAARLLADMGCRPAFYFARMEVPRLLGDLREFQAEQWSIQKMIRSCELESRTSGRMAWPRNTGACIHPYRCQFLDVCRGVMGDPENEIPMGFRRAERAHEELPEIQVGKE
jgi:hypothetical protein